MKHVALASCLLIAAALPAGATSMSMPGFEVNQVNAAVYEVVSEGLHGGGPFWCAAATFVMAELRMSPETEIYVVRGAGPSVTTDRRSAAQFTVDPAAAGIKPAPMSDDLNVLNVGSHMTAGIGKTYCP